MLYEVFTVSIPIPIEIAIAIAILMPLTQCRCQGRLDAVIRKRHNETAMSTLRQTGYRRIRKKMRISFIASGIICLIRYGRTN
jgi:hypothetical protein